MRNGANMMLAVLVGDTILFYKDRDECESRRVSGQIFPYPCTQIRDTPRGTLTTSQEVCISKFLEQFNVASTSSVLA